MIATPCWPSAGPIGGAGVALPAGIWSLTYARIFLANLTKLPSYDAQSQACWIATCCPTRRRRQQPAGDSPPLCFALDLQEVELDRHFAAEERDEHLDLALLLVDLVDAPRKSLNGPSMMRTESPTDSVTFTFGASAAMPLMMRLYFVVTQRSRFCCPCRRSW